MLGKLSVKFLPLVALRVAVWGAATIHTMGRGREALHQRYAALRLCIRVSWDESTIDPASSLSRLHPSARIFDISTVPPSL